MNNDALSELANYARLEGSEIGEACSILLSANGYQDYFSDEFNSAVEKELSEHLKTFRENSVISEREITYTEKVRELVWV